MAFSDLPRAKRFIPKSRADRFAFCFTVVILFVVGIFEATVILPDIYPEYGIMFWVYIAIGLALYINCMGNILMVMYVDATSGSNVLPSILKPGWRYCAVCLQNSPPRSFHCFSCENCILKRDHHCAFTGKCIGHYNQRFYMMALLYLFLGALFANFLNFDHAWAILGGLTWQSFFTMILPLLAYIIGLTHGYTFIMAFLCGTCFFAGIFISVLLYWHAQVVLNGQTTHEKATKDRQYDLGWKENLRGVLGEKWHLVWLFPLISSPLPGNGLEFTSRLGSENVKDL
ncbi:putative palmitoyltransferase ZDHHC24 [Glandiceps talaboti]